MLCNKSTLPYDFKYDHTRTKEIVLQVHTLIIQRYMWQKFSECRCFTADNHVKDKYIKQ